MNDYRITTVLTLIVAVIFAVVVAWYSMVFFILLGIVFFVWGLFFLYRHVLIRKTMTISPRFYDFIIFLLLFSGPPRLRSRDPMASLHGVVDWAVLLQIMVWGLGALWVVRWMLIDLLKKRPFHFQLLEVKGLLFVSSLVLSIMVSPAPLLTSFRIFQLYVLILFSHYWVRKFGEGVTFKSLTIGYILLAIIIAVAAIFKPDLVYVGARLRGDYIADAGAVGAVGLILLLSYNLFKKNAFFYVLCVTVLSWVLIASRTRTAYAAFLVFLLIVLIRQPRIKRLHHIKWLIILFIPVMVVFHSQLFLFFIRDLQSISTLSDRTRIWRGLVEYVLRHSPLLGLGFGTERTVTLLINSGVGTAHGTFPAVFAGGGILGAITFGIFLISVYKEAIKLFFMRDNVSVYFIVAVVLIAIFIIGITTEEVVIPSPIALTFFMMVSLLSAYIEKRRTGVKRVLVYENSTYT